MTRDIDDETFAREIGRGGAARLVPAALLLAREIAYPELQPSRYLERLAGWSEAAGSRAARAGGPVEAAKAVAEFMFADMGLGGNRQAYDDPRNSFLNDVMDRRLGLPIALSALYLEVAGAIGLPVEGIALPGHFIVAVRHAGEQHFMDPFSGGRLISRDQLPALVYETSGSSLPLAAAWLEPASPRAILARMLFNLRNSFARREAWNSLLLVVERLRELQPDAPEHIRDEGAICMRAGLLRRAEERLSLYLRLAPATPDRMQVAQTVDSMTRRLLTLN
jgi:regulator of sirC expression with transglutaminase-like and TPR domain